MRSQDPATFVRLQDHLGDHLQDRLEDHSASCNRTWQLFPLPIERALRLSGA